MNEVWDQFIRNEEAFTRLLKLDELLSLNQKINELIEGRLPRPKEPTPLLTPEAMKMILPLIYEQVRLRAYPDLKKGRVELQVTTPPAKAGGFFWKAGFNSGFLRNA